MLQMLNGALSASQVFNGALLMGWLCLLNGACFNGVELF